MESFCTEDAQVHRSLKRLLDCLLSAALAILEEPDLVALLATGVFDVNGRGLVEPQRALLFCMKFFLHLDACCSCWSCCRHVDVLLLRRRRAR